MTNLVCVCHYKTHFFEYNFLFGILLLFSFFFFNSFTTEEHNEYGNYIVIASDGQITSSRAIYRYTLDAIFPRGIQQPRKSRPTDEREMKRIMIKRDIK